MGGSRFPASLSSANPSKPWAKTIALMGDSTCLLVSFPDSYEKKRASSTVVFVYPGEFVFDQMSQTGETRVRFVSADYLVCA